jgi:uncharacterized membrane protein
MDAELSSSEKSPANIPASIPADSPENGAAIPAQATVNCPHCETVMPANAAFCPGCGWSMTPLPPVERAIAVVAYLPLIPPGVLLLLPAFRDRRFVRFHAWQSILLWGVFFVLIGATIVFSSVASPMLVLLFGLLVSLAMLFLWIVLSLKAWQGERFELPLFGELAGRMR